MSTNYNIKDNYNKNLVIKSVIYFVFLAILALICILPIYILVINATRTSTAIVNGVSFIPSTHLFRNLKELITEPSYKFDAFTGFRNSFIISASATFLSIFFSCLTAYGLSVYDFRLKGPAYTFVISVMMIPMQVTSVGFLQFMNNIGLTNTYIPLIVPAIAAPPIVFFMRQYMKSSFPLEIVEASRIDGCGEFRTFLQIGMPIMKPAVAVQSIFAFIANWNNFYMPSMILVSRKESQLTLPMLISIISTNDKMNDYGVIYAAIALSIVPLVIVYLLCSKFIIAGVALGGVKE
jgi:ABC-type glycerol-3-phosphate transport system permease component